MGTLWELFWRQYFFGGERRRLPKGFSLPFWPMQYRKEETGYRFFQAKSELSGYNIWFFTSWTESWKNIHKLNIWAFKNWTELEKKTKRRSNFFIIIFSTSFFQHHFFNIIFSTSFFNIYIYIYSSMLSFEL